jgi:hypothetical protein
VKRANRSAYVAHETLRDDAAQRVALQTFPRLQSVRLLHVAKRRRDARRERNARAAVVILLAALPVALFYFGSM